MSKKGLWMLMAVVVSCQLSVVSGQTREPMAMPVVEEDSIMKHIIELTSERYKGRMAGTVGYDEAMRYVEKVLKS